MLFIAAAFFGNLSANYLTQASFQGNLKYLHINKQKTLNQEEIMSLTAPQQKTLINKFCKELLITKPEDRESLFVETVNAHKELIDSGRVRDLFNALYAASTFEIAFRALARCDRGNNLINYTISELVWEKLISNVGIGGKIVNEVLMILERFRPDAFHKVTDTIRARIGKLKETSYFDDLIKK